MCDGRIQAKGQEGGTSDGDSGGTEAYRREVEDVAGPSECYCQLGVRSNFEKALGPDDGGP